jgi:hypothetical protein
MGILPLPTNFQSLISGNAFQSGERSGDLALLKWVGVSGVLVTHTFIPATQEAEIWGNPSWKPVQESSS